MKTKLSHSYSQTYVDNRLLDMKFCDVSWNNDETGSVHRTIGEREIYIYCPDESRKGSYDAYCVIDETKEQQVLIEWTQDVSDVISLIKKIELSEFVGRVINE